MTKLHELINRHDTFEAVGVLITYYPGEVDNAEGYVSVVNMLKDMKPDESCDYKIEVYKDVDEDVGEYFGVHGVRADSEASYAIEFEPWNQWLAAEITNESLENNSEIEIIAHCIFEMTFAGFNEGDVSDQFDNLMSEIQETAEGIDDCDDEVLLVEDAEAHAVDDDA